MTLGERLEEARKRKGISLRDAAEATKIRSDYLASFENNSFDISLPPVYVRGFLKIYARFLCLDAEKIVVDYDAMQRSGRGARRDLAASRPEVLGRLELGERGAGSRSAGTATAEAQSEGEGTGTATATAEPRPRRERHAADAGPPLDTAMKIRIGLAVAATVVVIVLLWGLIKLLTRDRTEDISNPAGAASVSRTASPSGGSSVVQDKRVELVALDDVAVVLDEVSDTGETRRLYAGQLARGERLPMTFRSALRVQFSEGRFLHIERNGQVLAVQQVGPGRTTIR